MPPGGTPECPDDKNRQGCACPKLGDTAACWPGLRKNRGLGICRDGVTTCVPNGEIGSVWGPCEGYILPIPGTTTGKEACNCFRRGAGRWTMSCPCFYTASDGKHMGAASAVLNGTTPTCEKMMDGKLMVPSKPWSPNKLTVDCVGHFRLCYTIKAGDVKTRCPPTALWHRCAPKATIRPPAPSRRCPCCRFGRPRPQPRSLVLEQFKRAVATAR